MATMNGTEIAATRHLIGLTRKELAEACGVSEQAVKQWEANKSEPYESRIEAIEKLRREHDIEVARLADGAADGMVIAFPDGPKPRGWYLAMAARVLDREPDAMLDWA